MHDSDSFQMRNDFVKAVHGMLLHRVGVEAAAAFWDKHPLVINGQLLSRQALALHIWNEKATSPAPWMMRVANSLEEFLLPHGVGIEDFHESIRSFGNQGSFVHSRYLLTWLHSILRPLYRFGDPYRLLLHGARLVFARFSSKPQTCIVPCRREERMDGGQHGTLWLTFPALIEGWLEPWDFQVQTGSHIVAAPRLFGLPPYQSLTMICDARPPELVLWQGECRRTAGQLFIDGHCYGTVTDAASFLHARGYDPRRMVGLSLTGEVVVVSRNYHCPVRKRVVLQEGCAYGASGYLARLQWLKPARQKGHFLSILHDDVSNEPPRRDRIEQLHASYMEAMARTVEVSYFAEDDSVAVEGRHVCRGVPALILRECVRIALSESRQDFSFREFKRRPELLPAVKNAGFETRLLRLREALQKADCGLTIALPARGRFRLETQGRLQLQEFGPTG